MSLKYANETREPSQASVECVKHDEIAIILNCPHRQAASNKRREESMHKLLNCFGGDAADLRNDENLQAIINW